mmetsp:Transcript_6892/g.14881  ORF Transcript_6892/g.14881 Transcript_6892/m.14881 type:complete len:106 (+) Transcript_6892:1187-1504(+)
MRLSASSTSAVAKRRRSSMSLQSSSVFSPSLETDSSSSKLCSRDRMAATGGPGDDDAGGDNDGVGGDDDGTGGDDEGTGGDDDGGGRGGDDRKTGAAGNATTVGL